MPPTKQSTPSSSSSGSPPEFDFNLPCRYFKSSFARSLSLNNGGSHWKSLDFDMGQYQQINNHQQHNSSLGFDTKSVGPPVPLRSATAAGIAKTSNINVKNEVNCSSENAADHLDDNNDDNNNKNMDGNSSNSSIDSSLSEEGSRPPALPARAPLKPPPQLAQFRPAAAGGVENAKMQTNASGSGGNLNKTINHTTQCNNNNSNGSSSIGVCNRSRSRCRMGNIRRNMWPSSDIPQQQQHQQQQPTSQQQQIAANNENAMNTPNYGANTTNVAMTRNTASTTATVNPPQPPPAATAATTPAAYKQHENTVNVEVVLLQNQVDTLHWQLKQVETSCTMYRAVIEEVARFLDRYHSQKQQQQQLQQQQQTLQKSHSPLRQSGGMEQISRSKSLYQVYAGGLTASPNSHEMKLSGGGGSSEHLNNSNSGYLRTRSSANLMDPKHATNITNTSTEMANKHATLASERSQYEAMMPGHSYTAFKDFTWRRTPKKQSECKANAAAADLEAKLNQEAFRLSRTIHNLLNTSIRQPDLTQHRNAPASLSANRNKPEASTPQAASPVPHNATLNAKPTIATEMLFLRAHNMRDSRLSLRSSTDSSVHSSASSSAASSSASSTTSSKLETDEEATHFHSMPFMPLSNKPLQHHQLHPFHSATEDESGFSSISSFQDVGLPLSSTMISNGSSTPSRNSLASLKMEQHSSPIEMEDYNLESRNSTLQAPVATNEANNLNNVNSSALHPTNVVGVPLQATHNMQHRWDAPHTPTKTFRNANKFQRFSTLSNEESSAVLWV